MMNEKRFRVNDLVKYSYSDIGEYIDENHTDRPLRNDEVCDLLNELSDENRQLKQQIEIEKKWQLEKDKYYVKIKEENEQLRKELDSFNPVMFNDMQKGTIILYSKGGIDE